MLETLLSFLGSLLVAVALAAIAAYYLLLSAPSPAGELHTSGSAGSGRVVSAHSDAVLAGGGGGTGVGGGVMGGPPAAGRYGASLRSAAWSARRGTSVEHPLRSTGGHLTVSPDGTCVAVESAQWVGTLASWAAAQVLRAAEVADRRAIGDDGFRQPAAAASLPPTAVPAPHAPAEDRGRRSAAFRCVAAMVHQMSERLTARITKDPPTAPATISNTSSSRPPPLAQLLGFTTGTRHSPALSPLGPSDRPHAAGSVAASTGRYAAEPSVGPALVPFVAGAIRVEYTLAPDRLRPEALRSVAPASLRPFGAPNIDHGRPLYLTVPLALEDGHFSIALGAVLPLLAAVKGFGPDGTIRLPANAVTLDAEVAAAGLSVRATVDVRIVVVGAAGTPPIGAPSPAAGAAPAEALAGSKALRIDITCAQRPVCQTALRITIGGRRLSRLGASHAGPAPSPGAEPADLRPAASAPAVGASAAPSATTSPAALVEGPPTAESSAAAVPPPPSTIPARGRGGVTPMATQPAAAAVREDKLQEMARLAMQRALDGLVFPAGLSIHAAFVGGGGVESRGIGRGTSAASAGTGDAMKRAPPSAATIATSHRPSIRVERVRFEGDW